jgi:hypothetical protein
MSEPNLNDTIICECCGLTANANDPTWGYANGLAQQLAVPLGWDIVTCETCVDRAVNENGAAVMNSINNKDMIATSVYDFLWDKIQSNEWWGKGKQ